MVLETKDKMGKLCKILYLDRDDIIECPVCHNKIYGRAIAINNGFLVEKEDILQ